MIIVYEENIFGSYFSRMRDIAGDVACDAARHIAHDAARDVTNDVQGIMVVLYCLHE